MNYPKDSQGIVFDPARHIIDAATLKPVLNKNKSFAKLKNNMTNEEEIVVRFQQKLEAAKPDTLPEPINMSGEAMDFTAGEPQEIVIEQHDSRIRRLMESQGAKVWPDEKYPHVLCVRWQRNVVIGEMDNGQPIERHVNQRFDINSQGRLEDLRIRLVSRGFDVVGL